MTNNLFSSHHNDILVKIIVFMHVCEKSEKTIFVKHFDIISFVFIEYVAQVDLQQTEYHIGVDFVNNLAVLNRINNYESNVEEVFVDFPEKGPDNRFKLISEGQEEVLDLH